MRRDYTLHCLRAFLGSFTPLTFAQFVALRGSIWSNTWADNGVYGVGRVMWKTGVTYARVGQRKINGE